MLIRTLTGVISLVIFFVILFMPSAVFNVAVYIVLAGILFEVYKATNPEKPLAVVGCISAVMIVVGKIFGYIVPAVILSAMIYMIMCVMLHGDKKYTEVIGSAFITWYIVVFFSMMCDVRHDFDIYGVIMVCLCAWFTDTAAFFFGKFLGKHKLIEKVSPKKTVEGAIGGTISTAVASAVYAFILMQLNVISHSVSNYTLFAFLGLLGAVLAQFGDLFASAIKRDCDIKDFGSIFPGHGGIFDRFDSVVFIIPFIYYFMSYFDLMRL